MGSAPSTTIVYVGTARLPQPWAAAGSLLAVELTIDTAGRRIVAVATNTQLPSLERLLWEVLVHAPVARAGEALLEIEVRYCSPLMPALRSALQAALTRALEDAPKREEPSPVAAASSNGHQPADLAYARTSA